MTDSPHDTHTAVDRMDSLRHEVEALSAKIAAARDEERRHASDRRQVHRAELDRRQEKAHVPQVLL